MYRAMIPMLLLAATAAGAAPQAELSPRDEARLTKQLAGLVAGPPQDCITPSRSQGGSRYGEVSLIRDRQNTLFMSRFDGGCSVRDSDALISRRPGERLCRGDIVEARDLVSGMSSGSCVYGDFVPYRRPAR